MKLQNGYLPRKGDKISISAIVRFDVEPDDPYVYAQIEGSRTEVSPDLAGIELAAIDWKVGDVVRLEMNRGKVGDVNYHIIALYERHAGVARLDGSPPIFTPFDNLLPAPVLRPQPAPDPMPAPPEPRPANGLDGDEEPVF